MNQVLESLRGLQVRRSTIWLCVAWVAIFVLYLGVRPEPVTPQQQSTVPVVPATRTPVPIETYAPTTEPTTTTTIPPTSTTPSGALNRTSPSATTTTQVIPLIPNELIPPGLLPAQPTPTPTETPR
ncbi:hypothetical protein OG921_15805 [Aldersonia sp. NBC_00410]|jgi:hypothetical protein|uniref:hypothetical protein n=1 Tax=Aldersonia sp. NBC_00410 TaxID=2975954 RepID=UPI00225AE500|nr:hypothetical protein [Aldersonia sp. NBC_00410]MCX5044635.1 hypothetical protein [Aldersonia sp. NBC_00410]